MAWRWITETQPTVLAVDDERPILSVIALELKAQGYRVLTAQNADDAQALVDEHRPDIAVLDLLMPDMSGMELMRRLREHHYLPVILLTAMGSSTDKVRGLDMGADDYLAKPFDPSELTARVGAVLRRAPTQAPGMEHVVMADNGKVEIDLGKRTVRRNGELIILSRTEWLLLQYLAQNAGKILLNNQILSSVWGTEYSNEFRYLSVWVFRLRQKLEENPSAPRIITTRPGVGLMLVPTEALQSLHKM